MQVDKHVVKMILETAQLLSTAHRLIDGLPYSDTTKTGRSVKRWRLTDERDKHLYSATHVNHPSAVWCRENSGNYNWLFAHFLALLDEYTYRYGKQHKCGELAYWLRTPPFMIKVAEMTPVTPAMPDHYKVPNDSVASYRNYYKDGKKHLHKYTNREIPEWML